MIRWARDEARACASVLATTKSTPDRPETIMLLTALPPAPPTPHTTMRGFSSLNRGDFRSIGISCLHPPHGRKADPCGIASPAWPACDAHPARSCAPCVSLESWPLWLRNCERVQATVQLRVLSDRSTCGSRTFARRARSRLDPHSTLTLISSRPKKRRSRCPALESLTVPIFFSRPASAPPPSPKAGLHELQALRSGAAQIRLRSFQP